MTTVGGLSFDVPQSGFETIENPDGSYRTVTYDPQNQTTDTQRDSSGNAISSTSHPGGGSNFDLSSTTSVTDPYGAGGTITNPDGTGPVGSADHQYQFTGVATQNVTVSGALNLPSSENDQSTYTYESGTTTQTISTPFRIGKPALPSYQSGWHGRRGTRLTRATAAPAAWDGSAS